VSGPGITGAVMVGPPSVHDFLGPGRPAAAPDEASVSRLPGGGITPA
jgi:hypothetical protein